MPAGDYGFLNTKGAAAKGVACKSYCTSGSFRWYTNQALKFAPAAGITLKNIKIRSQRESYVFSFTKDPADTQITYSNEDKTKAEMITLTATLNSAEPVILQPQGQIRSYYIELEYEGTLAQPKVPVCSATLPYVAADQEITLTAEEGAAIHYTTDGTVPTVDSPVYSAPFKLKNDAIVRAIAVKDGVSSFPFYAEYFSVPAGLEVATFNYNRYKTLTWKDGSKIQESDWSLDSPALPCNCRIDLDGKSFTENGIDVAFAKSEANAITLFRSWTFGNVVELRPNGDLDCTQTYSAAEGNTIERMVVVGSSIATKDKVTPMAVAEGTFTLSPVNFFNGKWEGSSQSVTLKSGTYVDQVYVFYKKDPSSVADLANDNAPVEYFNLQGVRVANPENGIFIRRQGSKVTKVAK